MQEHFQAHFFFTYVVQLIRIVFNVQCHVSQNKDNCFTFAIRIKSSLTYQRIYWNILFCQVAQIIDKNKFVSPCRNFFVLCLGSGGKIWCMSLYSRFTRSHHIFYAIFLIICEFNNFISVYINLQSSDYFWYWMNQINIVRVQKINISIRIYHNSY